MMPGHHALLGFSLLSLACLGAACTAPPTEVTSGIGVTDTDPGSGTTGSGPQADTGGTGDTGDTGDTDPTGGTGPVFDPVCGDGLIEGEEECDLGAENGLGDYCTLQCTINECGDGYLGPGEACDDGNQNNDDQCTINCGLSTCGDGFVQAGEECDNGPGNSLDGACLPSCLNAYCGDQNIHNGVETCDSNNTGGATCQSQGFDDGVLECADDCMSYDTSNCHACGNGAIEVNEICDNNTFPAGTTCQTYAPGGATVSGGSLACTNNCQVIDSSGCAFCGNGVSEGPFEDCDGSDFDGATCQDYAGGGQVHSGGSLACSNNCMSINSNACTFCGDGNIEGSEQCEGGNFGGETCVSLNFDGGNLACTNDTCQRITTGCYACGDGDVDPGEECDGANLDGETCATVMMDNGYRGPLSCSGSCTFDTSGCCLSIGEVCTSNGDCCSNNCANVMGPNDICET